MCGPVGLSTATDIVASSLLPLTNAAIGLSRSKNITQDVSLHLAGSATLVGGATVGITLLQRFAVVVSGQASGKYARRVLGCVTV